MRLLLLFFLFLNGVEIMAQNHDFIWITDVDGTTEPNDGNLLNFSTYPPTISSNDINLDIDITLASICDAQGQLLFYSNGVHVMNVDQDTMDNGDFIISGVTATDIYPFGYPLFDGILVLPLPDYPHQYYLISQKIDENGGFFSFVPYLMYSIIDMNEANGKGRVIIKEQFLAEAGYFEHPSAVKHANGRDWWVVVPHRDTAQLFRFLLTPEGITDTLTIKLDYDKSSDPEGFDGRGQNLFSRDGSRFIDYDRWNGVRIFDFDRCDGTFGTPYIFKRAHQDGFCAQMSSNNRILYTADWDTVYQYDLYAEDIEIPTAIMPTGLIPNTPQYVSSFTMQLMPDGKIYIVGGGGKQYMHYINYPNRKGLACELVVKGLELPNRYILSKPNFPNYRLGPMDGSTCDTLGTDNIPVAKYRYDQDTLNALAVQFTDLSYYEPMTWFWDFGDGTTSTDTCPAHTFPAPGVYEVCLTVTNNNLPDGHTFCQTLYLGVVGTSETIEFKTVLFPNPFRQTTSLMVYDYLPEDAYILLSDITGREVFRQRAAHGSNVLELSHLPSGVYVYRVLEQGKEVSTGKVVKQ